MLPKFRELDNFLTISDIDEEIFLQEKKIFNLKMNKKIKKDEQFKSHLFVHIKRRIAQLQFKKSTILKQFPVEKK